MPLGGLLAYEDELSPVGTDHGDTNDMVYTDSDADLTEDETDMLVAMLAGKKPKKRSAGGMMHEQTEMGMAEEDLLASADALMGADDEELY